MLYHMDVQKHKNKMSDLLTCLKLLSSYCSHYINQTCRIKLQALHTHIPPIVSFYD